MIDIFIIPSIAACFILASLVYLVYSRKQPQEVQPTPAGNTLTRSIRWLHIISILLALIFSLKEGTRLIVAGQGPGLLFVNVVALLLALILVARDGFPIWVRPFVT